MAKPEAEAPDEPKDLSEAIGRIDGAMKTLLKSGLNRKAVIVLLHDYTKVSKRDIETVLSGLENLKEMYTR
jgi:hypothetical protein